MRYARFLVLLFAVLLSYPIIAQQSSDLSLSDRDTTLESWNSLYNQGQLLLGEQRNTLESLGEQVKTLSSGYSELMRLSETLSASNKALKVFNEQIGKRMQERDEDLAQAYSELNRLELESATRRTTIVGLIASNIILFLLLAFAIALAIAKAIRRIK